MPTGHHKSLKRKVLGVVDQISDDFSDFSLSSPATKIRRLHGELPPIVEEHEQEEHEPLPNEERALVLFKPFLHHSPDYNHSSFSLTLNSDLISQIKTNQVSWSKQCDYSSDYCDPLKIEEQEQNDDSDNCRLAIVPWVQQQQHLPSCSNSFDDSEDNDNTNTIELMEADEEGVMMDVEEQDCDNAYNNSTTMFMVSEGFQQHCLLPHIPQNTSTPITWTR